MLSFIPRRRFLPGLVIVQKIDFLKTLMPEDISQLCREARAVHKKGPPRVAVGR